MAQIEIKAYKQDRPADWLEKNPQEKWRCDISSNGRDYHGTGATESEATRNAKLAYREWTDRNLGGDKGILDDYYSFEAMNVPRRPSDDLPTPEETELAETQRATLDDLPDEPGFYWCRSSRTGCMRVCRVDKNLSKGTLDAWGHVMDATPGGIDAIQRWLDLWEIHDRIGVPEIKSVYQSNDTFGAF